MLGDKVQNDKVVDTNPSLTAQSQPAAPTTPTNTTATAVPQAKPIDPRDPWEGVSAMPLAAPAIDQIKLKNPNIVVRWVNRSVGKDTPTLRYEQMLAMGWVNATEADVIPPPGSVKDGTIQYYDVILMKIDRARYLGQLRFNNERVNKAVRRMDIVRGANTILQEDLNREGIGRGKYTRADGSKKVSAFVPGDRDFADVQ